MPKRLREHIRAQEIAWESVEAPIDWPCARCKQEFRPKRNPLWFFKATGKEYERFCAPCQITNLIVGLCDTPAEQEELRALIAPQRGIL